jgi:transcriptional regulator with XRE-family HTH domain
MDQELLATTAQTTGPVSYAVRLGRRLRAVRRRHRATLSTIAGAAGVSVSFLSQVERGRTGVSLPTLRRIARALGVTVADLFEPDQASRPRLLRREDRPCMELEGFRNFLLTPRPLKNLEVFCIELDPHDSTAEMPFAHGESEEVIIVLSGQIQVTVGDATYELHPGDSVTYSSASPHLASNVGNAPAEAIIVLSPPTM